MADRRMLSIKIVGSDNFLNLPMSAQLLYFHLNVRADDDGFVNNTRNIICMIGCSQEDLTTLIENEYLIRFSDGVIAIKHWKVNNWIRKDRYTETIYLNDKALLEEDEAGIYHLTDMDQDGGNPIGNHDGNHSGNPIGCISNKVNKDNKSNKSKEEEKEEPSSTEPIISEWNTLPEPVPKISKMSASSTRAKMLKARVAQYGVEEIIRAINNVKHSPFLLGLKTDFVITFDWFVKPNNFVKVLDGNYLDRNAKQQEQAVREEPTEEETIAGAKRIEEALARQGGTL